MKASRSSSSSRVLSSLYNLELRLCCSASVGTAGEGTWREDGGREVPVLQVTEAVLDSEVWSNRQTGRQTTLPPGSVPQWQVEASGVWGGKVCLQGAAAIQLPIKALWVSQPFHFPFASIPAIFIFCPLPNWENPHKNSCQAHVILHHHQFHGTTQLLWRLTGLVVGKEGEEGTSSCSLFSGQAGVS